MWLWKQVFQDILVLYKMFSEVDVCEFWIDEKEQWFNNMQILEKLEDLEVIQYRFESLELEMNNQVFWVVVVNQIVCQLMYSGYLSEKEIKVQQDKFNIRWSQFRELVDRKKDVFLFVLSIQNYYFECNEIKFWIWEKIKVIEFIQDLGNDLVGVMVLQCKLIGMEWDLVVIEVKLSDLQKEVEKLEFEYFDQVQVILFWLVEISDVWEEMKIILKN